MSALHLENEFIILIMENKICITCNTEKTLNNFLFNKSGIKKQQKVYESRMCKTCTYKKEFLRRKELREDGFKEEGTSCHNNLKKYLVWKAKSNARIKGIKFAITVDDIVLSAKCPILDVEYDMKSTWFMPSIDKIIPSLGYVPGNVKVISFMANHMKSHATKEQLITFSKNITSYLNDDIVRTNENKQSLELENKESLG